MRRFCLWPIIAAVAIISGLTPLPLGAAAGENLLLANDVVFIDRSDGRSRRFGDFLQGVAKQLVAVSPEPLLSLQVQLLANDSANAYARCLNRQVVVNRGLLAAIETTDQLAVLLGHEVGHCLVDLRHYFSAERDRELAADVWSLALAAGAGYDPAAALTLAAIKERLEEGTAAAAPTDHLPWPRRTQALRQALAARSFPARAARPLPFERAALRGVTPLRQWFRALESGQYEGLGLRLARLLGRFCGWKEELLAARHAFRAEQLISELADELRASAPNLPLAELTALAREVRPELADYGVEAGAAVRQRWRALFTAEIPRLVELRQKMLTLARR